MSKANWLRLAQAFLLALQVVNAGAAATNMDPKAALIISAIVAGVQYWVHETALQTPPPS